MASEEIVRANSLDDHAVCLADAARRRGISTEVVFGTSWPLSRPKRPWLRLSLSAQVFYFRLGRLLRAAQDGGLGRPLNGPAHILTRNKQRTKEVLARAGFPVPPGRMFKIGALDQALLYAAEYSGELCVKPNRGGKGDLVFPRLRDADSILEACLAVAGGYEEVLLEASVPGEVWRYFYVHPNIVGVKYGRPANVIGDGKTALAGLIELKDAERERRCALGHFPIPSGPALTAMLGARDCRWNRWCRRVVVFSSIRFQTASWARTASPARKDCIPVMRSGSSPPAARSRAFSLPASTR